jgi:CAAX protease family protein
MRDGRYALAGPKDKRKNASGVEITMRPKERVDLTGICWYVGIACGIAWTVEFFAFVCRGIRLDRNPPAWSGTVLAGAMFAPAISAVLVRLLRREGFASAGFRFGPWRFYLLIGIGAPLIFAAVYGVTVTLGSGQLDPSLGHLREVLENGAGRRVIPYSNAGILLRVAAISVGVAPFLNSFLTFGEEFGWTGYLVPKLMPLGRWKAAVIYGLAWGLWHAPLIALGYDYPHHAAAGVLFMCLFTLAVGLFQVALRIKTGGVLAPSFLHACLNAQGQGIWPILVVGINPLLGGITGLAGLAVLAPLGVWALAKAGPTEAPVE